MANALTNVRILPNAAAALPLLMDELRGTQLRRGLLGLATGATFVPFLQALGDELRTGRMRSEELHATHLDEYLGYGPERKGGMVHELGTHCPPLLDLLAAGRFLPVPHDGDAASLKAHELRVYRAGGVQLQLLGIGRNGHIAFNEPGTPFNSGFHVTALAPTTRDDARTRFAPDEPPQQAVTSGLQTILGARKLVLCAFGKSKAKAVATMVQGEISVACPASVLRRHTNVLVLLDPEAASELGTRSGA
jgi:glucosamine-6-phosphate deaminase